MPGPLLIHPMVKIIFLNYHFIRSFNGHLFHLLSYISLKIRMKHPFFFPYSSYKLITKSCQVYLHNVISKYLFFRAKMWEYSFKMQVGLNHMKSYSASLIMKMYITLHYFRPTRISIIKLRKKEEKCWWGYEEIGNTVHGWWECKMV